MAKLKASSLGETHSEKFWSDRLARRLVEDYDAGIGKCITVELPDGVRAMALSIAWNAGAGRRVRLADGQEVERRRYRGRLPGAPDEKCRKGNLPAGALPPGRKGPERRWSSSAGLINRRADERKKCLAAAREPAPLVAAAPVPFPPPVVAPPAPPAAPVVETPKPSWWRSLLARLRCWIFKCEAAK